MNKRGEKSQLQTKSQTAARTARAEGCGGAGSDTCRCPPSRGGVLTLPAASDLTEGAAVACKMCCAKKANNQGSPRASLSPGNCATAAAEPAQLPAAAVHVLGCSSLDHRGDFRAEKCSFPSNNHRRRDLPTHTSSLSQVQTEDTRHLHGAEQGRQPREPSQPSPPRAALTAGLSSATWQKPCKCTKDSRIF